jgi:hypothetical protein
VSGNSLTDDGAIYLGLRDGNKIKCTVSSVSAATFRYCRVVGSQFRDDEDRDGPRNVG